MEGNEVLLKLAVWGGSADVAIESAEKRETGPEAKQVNNHSCMTIVQGPETGGLFALKDVINTAACGAIRLGARVMLRPGTYTPTHKHLFVCNTHTCPYKHTRFRMHTHACRDRTKTWLETVRVCDCSRDQTE